MANPCLIVVPLDGALPFRIENDSWKQTLIQGAEFDRTGDFYVIDPCEKAVLDAPSNTENRTEEYDWFGISTKEEQKILDAELSAAAQEEAQQEKKPE